MKRKWMLSAFIGSMVLALVACRLTSGGSLGPQLLQPTSPVSTVPPTANDLSGPAGQADQSLNNLESTLQAQGSGGSSLDTGPVDQSLNDLESTLASQGSEANSVDTSQTDQSLNDLIQALQAEPTP
jgi:hypothetical protein